MKHSWPLWLVLFAACGETQPTAESEVAGELRALRSVLVQRAAEPATPATGSRPLDPTQFTAALSPLRELLDALVKQQAELQQRQLSLTQEMQRWSQLLVESVGATRREEGAAVSTRLQQLEAALLQQKSRNEQTEKLLQDALDRTADRLEEFLQRVGAEGAVAPAPAAPVPAPAPANAPPPKSIGDGARFRRGSAAASWWWGGVAIVGGLCGVVCFRRWRQRPIRGAPSLAPANVGPDEGVQEIWAAAALLGEAVGRLRESSSGAGAVGEDVSGDPHHQHDPHDSHDVRDANDGPAAPVSSDTEFGEFIVLDDELLRPDEVPAKVPQSLPKPAATVCRVRTVDPTRAMDAALQFLTTDPRVLRRPEPTVRCGGDNLEIAFRAVPGLPPGEQSHLEQSLRDVCA